VSELPPSEKRRAAARARGDVAVSPLACAAGALGGAALALVCTSSGVQLIGFAREMFGRAAAGETGGALAQVRALLSSALLPVALGAAAGALLVGVAQTRGLFALRAVGARPLVRGSRAVGWMLAAALAMLGVAAARAVLPALAHARGLAAVAWVARAAATATLPRVLLLFGAAGLGDWAWRRLRLERALRMSRAEAEAERREEEADPRVAAEARRRAGS
jgi:flagellar biosynthesis protein FlhB